MRILVDNGEHRHRNRGDIAMLQVSVERLAALWPDDPIGVLTADPARLAALVPMAIPVTLAHGWGGAHGQARHPSPLRRLLRGERARPQHAERWVDRVLDGVGLVVAGGGEYLTDVHPDQTERVLTLLTGAQDRNIPTLMFGQSLGPLRDERLRSLAEIALPGVRQLALRDGRNGPLRARELGVPDERVVVTGDDAVAASRPAASPRAGDGIGVNHRPGPRGTGTDRSVAAIRAAVQAVAARHGAPLVPISLSDADGDRAGCALLTHGYPDVVPDGHPDDPPSWAIRRLDRVRVVVTATYHLAVFALSRGIPVVCPVTADTVRDPLADLAEQFSPGCVLVDMDAREGDAETRLARVVNGMWDAADDVHDTLLRAADRQIATGIRAYATARDLVSPPFIPRP